MMYSDNDGCTVRFFFYNYGDFEAPKTNVFKVFVQFADGDDGVTGTKFETSEYIGVWNKAIASQKSRKPFRFVFTGTLNDPSGTIALDDISYTGGCHNSDAVYKPGHPHGLLIFGFLFFQSLIFFLFYHRRFSFSDHHSGCPRTGSLWLRIFCIP